MISLFGLIDSKLEVLPFYLIILIYIGVLFIFAGLSLYKKWLKPSGLVAAFLLGFGILYF